MKIVLKEEIEIMSSERLLFAMPATPVKKCKIITPDAPYKKPVCARNLDKKEKWAASNMSLKAKLAASNDAWMTEVTEAIMREDLSTFPLLAKALNDFK